MSSSSPWRVGLGSGALILKLLLFQNPLQAFGCRGAGSRTDFVSWDPPVLPCDLGQLAGPLSAPCSLHAQLRGAQSGPLLPSTRAGGSFHLCPSFPRYKQESSWLERLFRELSGQEGVSARFGSLPLGLREKFQAPESLSDSFLYPPSLEFHGKQNREGKKKKKKGKAA